MKKHFVIFYSPGTFVSESSEKPIGAWDVQEAKRLAADVTERHGAKPYGFTFVTRERHDDELDSRITQRSPMYYLGGKVETLEQVKARATSEDHILISNMECNGWNRIITNTNSWKITLPLQPEDVVLT